MRNDAGACITLERPYGCHSRRPAQDDALPRTDEKDAMPRAESPRSKAVRKAPRGTPSAASDASKATVQQAFLDELIRTRTRVSIFLVNGVKLEGEIRSYDRYVILMKNALTDKVYKHAVSTVMPMSVQPTATDTIVERRVPRVRRPGATSSGRG